RWEVRPLLRGLERNRRWRRGRDDQRQESTPNHRARRLGLAVSVTPLENQPSFWQRSEIVRFLRWQFSWRGNRCELIGLACLAVLIALFYAEENWRGKRAWENYEREWEAKGEKFD